MVSMTVGGRDSAEGDTERQGGKEEWVMYLERESKDCLLMGKKPGDGKRSRRQ